MLQNFPPRGTFANKSRHNFTMVELTGTPHTYVCEDSAAASRARAIFGEQSKTSRRQTFGEQRELERNNLTSQANL